MCFCSNHFSVFNVWGFREAWRMRGVWPEIRRPKENIDDFYFITLTYILSLPGRGVNSCSLSRQGRGDFEAALSTGSERSK